MNGDSNSYFPTVTSHLTQKKNILCKGLPAPGCSGLLLPLCFVFESFVPCSLKDGHTHLACLELLPSVSFAWGIYPLDICLTYSFFFFHFYFIFFSFIFMSWRLITLQYCSGFCHTLTWISHGFTCIPHSDPPSHLPLHPIPLGLPSAPGPSSCLMHPTWAGDLFHPR